MSKVLVLGAGKIGGAIVDMLAATGDYEITVADRDPAFLAMIPPEKARQELADLTDPAALRRLAGNASVVISARPFFLNPAVAVRALAEGAETAFMPQCGLAPGFVSVVAAHLAKQFDSLRDVHMRVGALPQFPANGLKYNLTWSTDGLINEYCNPCEAIHEGERTELLPLEGLERFSLDGIDYEAFNTSGGLGTLCDTLAGRVQSLNYKTVRYPGHRDAMKLLLEDLRLRDRRALLKDVLETAVPITHQDVVLIFVTVTGTRENRLTQETYAKKVYAREIEGRLMSAIQITTAAGVCAVVDLHRQGLLPARGFVRQEQVDLDAFLANRFGRHYA